MTIEQEDQIIRLYEEGKSVREIARLTEISKSSVHRTIKHTQIETNIDSEGEDPAKEDLKDTFPSGHTPQNNASGFPWIEIFLFIAFIGILAFLVWFIFCKKVI